MTKQNLQIDPVAQDYFSNSNDSYKRMRDHAPIHYAEAEDVRQQVRHWIDTSLEREPGQIALSEENTQANIDSGMYYYSLVQERRQNPQDDMISRLIAAEIPDEEGYLRKLDDIEITGFTTLLGGAGAETVTKLVGSAVVEFARHPEQWQMLLDDRSLLPA